MPETRCAVYIRVSTRDQRYVQQFREIRRAVEARGWRIAGIYKERRSAAPGTDRPEWRRLQRDAQLRRFGAVAAFSIDRLGRSALDILQAVRAFEQRGIQLFVLREGIATGDPSGQLVLTVLAGVAQLERDLISERTKMGLRAAKARGARVGRPRAYVSPHNLQEVRERRRTAASLARQMRVSVMTVRRRLAEVA